MPDAYDHDPPTRRESATGNARLLEQLPTLLKAERTRRHVTQSDVARELGLSVSTICRVEKKAQLPDVNGFLAIVGWLRIPGWWFIGDPAEAVVDAYRRGRDDAATAVRAALGDGEVDP